MTELRRSSRAAKKIVYAEDSENDSVDELNSEVEQDEYHSDSGPERTEQPKASKKRKATTPATKKSRPVKRKKNAPLSGKDVDSLEEQLVENYLYQSLSQPDLDLQDLALEWFDSYTEDQAKGTNESMTILINLILRCCGSVFLFQPHDLMNLESCAETVGELTIAFGAQKSHKYPFRSLSVFRKNVLGFFDELISTANENGMLYSYGEETDESEESLASPLMLHILTWISSLSSCTIRPLRQVSTVVLLSIQNQLCKIITSVISNLEKSQKQLTKYAKSKSKKDSIAKTVKSYHTQQSTITEYLTEISDLTLAHRYRDVDPLIRQECLSYLSQAMILYSDFFFQASFLRYFGWLLSDPQDTVRAEVSKIIVKLYKNNKSSTSLTLGFRQFTERYKDQFMNMCRLDSNSQVRLNCLAICCELLKIGFLSDTDSTQIVSILLHSIVDPQNISKSSLSKMKLEMCRFISVLVDKKVEVQLAKHTIFIEKYSSNHFSMSDEEDDTDRLHLRECLRVKCLINILDSASAALLVSHADYAASLQANVYHSIYETLYLSTFDHSLEFLVRYLLLDPHSIIFTSSDKAEMEPEEDTKSENEPDTTSTASVRESPEVLEIKNLLDLSTSDKLFILNFIHGSLRCIFDKTGKDSQEIITAEVTRLINYLPAVHSLSEKNPLLIHEFLRVWNVLLSQDNLLLSFTKLNQVNVYNDINIGMLKYCQSTEIDLSKSQDFEVYFSSILKDFSTTGSPLITPEIKLQVQNLLQELFGECRDVLHENDSISPSALKVQNKILIDVVECGKPLLKLSLLGEFVNLSSVERALLDLLNSGLLQNLDLGLIVDQWSHNFLECVDSVVTGYKSVLDFILVVFSWKLEKLIYSDEQHQARFDVVSTFSDLESMSKSLVALLKSIDDTITNVNANSDGEIKSQLIQKLNDLQTMVWAKFIDLTTSFRIFYIKFKNNNSFRNFNMYFNQGFGQTYISKVYPLDLQQQLLRLFLYKEVRLAKLLGVQLERSDEEDVNIEDLAEEEEQEVPQRSVFEEEEEDETSPQDTTSTIALKNKQKVWLVEKDMCVFAIKLFTLVDLAMVDEFLVDRMKLNSGVLGGIYLKILKQNEEKIASREAKDAMEARRVEADSQASNALTVETAEIEQGQPEQISKDTYETIAHTENVPADQEVVESIADDTTEAVSQS